MLGTARRPQRLFSANTLTKLADPQVFQHLQNIANGGVPPLEAAKYMQNVNPTVLKNFLDSNQHSGQALARLTPGGIGAHNLSFGQNMSALKHQAAQLGEGGWHKAPGRALRAAWRNSAGSGGGLSIGAGLRGRYITQGTRLGLATQLLPEAMNATKDIDVTGAGRSKTERVGAVVGGAAGNLLSALPNSVMGRFGVGGMAAQIGLGMAGQSVGKALGGAAGRLVDKGVSSLRGVQAGDASHALPGANAVSRQPGSNAI